MSNKLLDAIIEFQESKLRDAPLFSKEAMLQQGAEGNLRPTSWYEQDVLPKIEMVQDTIPYMIPVAGALGMGAYQQQNYRGKE